MYIAGESHTFLKDDMLKDKDGFFVRIRIMLQSVT
jgi:hypothetical protein